MEEKATGNGGHNEAGDWLYCEDEQKNKYVLYRGHPAFLAKFTGLKQCQIEGMEERFSFSDPRCRQLIELAERKGTAWFGAVSHAVAV